LKKVLALILALVMVLSLAACSKPAEPTTGTEGEGETASEENKFKIAVYTGTVSQGEEEFRAAEKMAEKYPDIIVTQTYPDNFTKEQETVIANALSLVSDPDVKALVMVQAVPGACAAFEKVREARPDVFIIGGVPGEDPDMIAKKLILYYRAMNFQWVMQYRNKPKNLVQRHSFIIHSQDTCLIRFWPREETFSKKNVQS